MGAVFSPVHKVPRPPLVSSCTVHGSVPATTQFRSIVLIIMSGSMIASAALKARVRRPALLSKLCKAEDLIHHFPNGAYIGWSGFTGVGAPKLGEFGALSVELNRASWHLSN